MGVGCRSQTQFSYPIPILQGQCDSLCQALAGLREVVQRGCFIQLGMGDVRKMVMSGLDSDEDVSESFMDAIL